MNKATSKRDTQEFLQNLAALPREMSDQLVAEAHDLAAMADEPFASNPPEEAVRELKAELERRRAERRAHG